MKFNNTLVEAETYNQTSTLDLDDLANPRLKNILTRIEQTKIRHAKEIEGLQKQLEQVKTQNNKTGASNLGVS